MPAPALFPYMTWMHTHGVRSSYCLSQSGMPAPDPAVLQLAGPPDLGPPPVEAQPALEARLAELFGVEAERVLVTHGASGAMHLTALRFFPGARVVTELPGYEPFRALASLYGHETTLVRRRAEDGFALDPEETARALGPDKSRGPAHLFLCNPHNPTGAVLSPEDLAGLARAAAQQGGLLISNEIYMEFARPAERVHAFALAPNAISIGSLTKAYGLGALRIGWMVLGEGLVDERASLLDRTWLVGLDPPTPTLRAGHAALGRLEALLAPARRFEAESRPLLERWLEASERVTGRVAPLGVNAFPRVHGVEDTRALAAYLALEHDVDVVPGEFFGAPGHLRVSYAVPSATLEEGLRRLERGLRAYPG